jgi:hypothetical protein
MTLGWPQFAMLVVSLFALSVTLAIVLVFDVSEFLSRLDVGSFVFFVSFVATTS